MRKRTLTLLIVLLVLIVIAALMFIPWGSGEETGPIEMPDRPMTTVEDMAGRKVEIPKDPRNILSMCTTVTDTLLRLGEGRRLGGIGVESTCIPATELAKVLGRGDEIARRQIEVTGIDLAFVWTDEKAAAKKLQDLGLPVLKVKYPRAEEVPDVVRFVARTLGREEAAEKLLKRVEEFLKQAKSRHEPEERPSVYLELKAEYATAGKNTYINDLINYADARNIAASQEGFGPLEPEKIVEADPDVILYVEEYKHYRAILQRQELQGLKALRKERISPVKRYWLVPGVGLPNAAASFRKAITEPKKPKGYEDILRPQDL